MMMQPPARTVDRHERLAVERELVGRLAPALSVDPPRRHVEPALDELVALDAREQLVERRSPS